MIYENTSNEIAAAEAGAGTGAGSNTETGCSFELQQIAINTNVNFAPVAFLQDNYNNAGTQNFVIPLEIEQQQQQEQVQYYYVNETVQMQQQHVQQIPYNMPQQQQQQQQVFELEQQTEQVTAAYIVQSIFDNNNENDHNIINQLSSERYLNFDAQDPAQRSQEELLDLTNASDASTVEDPDGEDIVTAESDEALAYLQGLNSDNLMQFSQQSAIQDLILKEQMGQKSQNLDILPTFEEHDIGGYKFQLEFPEQKRGKKSFWTYSSDFNKLYIRMDQLLNIQVKYTPKRPTQCLRIRVLLCFRKEVSEPVLRCQNHISKDMSPSDHVRHNMLRCENPNVEYQGSADGKGLHERFSVVIPLDNKVKSIDDNSVKQTIALKFTCQNSCVGRRETSLIFLLESLSGEILSQRVIDVKVCSCPRRDKSLEEGNQIGGGGSRKRKMPDDFNSRDNKITKREIESTLDAMKREIESASEFGDEEPEANDTGGGGGNPPKKKYVEPLSNGGFCIRIDCLNKEHALRVIQGVQRETAFEIAKKTNPRQKFKQHFAHLQRIYDEVFAHRPSNLV